MPRVRYRLTVQPSTFLMQFLFCYYAYPAIAATTRPACEICSCSHSNKESAVVVRFKSNNRRHSQKRRQYGKQSHKTNLGIDVSRAGLSRETGISPFRFSLHESTYIIYNPAYL